MNPVTVGGFTTARPNRRRRMVLALSGLDKCGKTHQALSAPGPIAFGNTDTGLEGVIEKFTKDGKVVYSKDYRVVVPPGATPQQIAEVGTKVWEEYKADFRAAWKSTVIRTTVADTESDTWELIRLARFGKLTQVMPHHYGPVNAEYAGFWNEVFGTDKNLILLGKMKREYDDAAKRYTDKLSRVGYKEIPYIVQINAVARYNAVDYPGFSIEITNCRQNSDLAGLVLSDEMCNFQALAQLVFPDSEPKDWE